MVDLWELAVPRNLDGRNGDVGVALDGQLEDGAIIWLGAAERSDNHTRIDRVRNMEELEGEFLLGLESYELCSLERFPRSHTNSNRDLPFSLTVNGYEISSPVCESFNKRKAWCGRFAELPSLVVKVTRNVSAPANETAFDSGLEEVNLMKSQVSFNRYRKTFRHSATYCSLKPPLIPAPLGWTATVASVKPQAEAAAAGNAAEASRQKGRVACHRCILRLNQRTKTPNGK